MAGPTATRGHGAPRSATAKWGKKWGRIGTKTTCPETNVGDVLGDLNARRGQIEDVGFRGQQRVITAKVPLRRMFGYATDLRSATQGRANYSMLFDSYDAWDA